VLDQTIVIYCICDEVLKSLDLSDDKQCKMSTAEVMAFSIMSGMLYGYNYRLTRLMSLNHKYFHKILSHSQLVRRIHQVPEKAWMMTFLTLQFFLRNEENDCFIVDSFPVKAYENHKSFRAKIFSSKEFHGYCASKKQYFFGIKVHMIINSDGVPIEFSFAPGRESDISNFRNLNLNFSKNDLILGDKAYTDYTFEDLLRESGGIQVLAKRKKRHKRQHNSAHESLLSKQRNYIETVFSCIVRRMPRYITARTEKGFCLKVMFFYISLYGKSLLPIRLITNQNILTSHL